MSTIIDNIKQHISNNRGKYGAVAGAGAVYGASQIPTGALLNQAGFNAMAHGQNLALDAADKIGYGKDQLQKLGLENKISPNAIQSGNDFYNSKLGQYINPNSSDMVNAAEQSSGIYNKMQEAKAQSQEVVNQAQAQGQNYLDQGINYIKGLNPFHESTNNSITIPIKKILLENIGKQIGYTALGTVGGIAAGGLLGAYGGSIVDGIRFGYQHPEITNLPEGMVNNIAKNYALGPDGITLGAMQTGISGGGIAGGLYGYHKSKQSVK